MISYLLGNYLVEEGFMTKEQLSHVISMQEKIRVKLGLIAVSEGMLTLDQADAINRLQQTLDKRFGDIAVEKGYLTDAQVGSLLKMQGNEYLTFAQTLVDEGIVTMDKLQLFLAKITRNLSFNRFQTRSAKKRGGGEIVFVLDELAECLAGEENVERDYEAKELGQCIRLFVRALPERDGNVFVRRYFFTELVSEIAQRYALTENHVMVILSRTRKKLKKHLIKEGFFGG